MTTKKKAKGSTITVTRRSRPRGAADQAAVDSMNGSGQTMFDGLRKQVFPKLVADRPASTPLRIWIAGCSSGETVYLTVMHLLEFLADTGQSFPVKVFATDVNAEAIARARSATYDVRIAEEVSHDQLGRYFLKIGEQYEVRRTLRDLCVFAVHDVLANPPFSRLDLIISGCNPGSSDDASHAGRLLPTFHYALKPGGFLVLQTGDLDERNAHLFQIVDRRQKILARSVADSRLSFHWKATNFPETIQSFGNHRATVGQASHDVRHVVDRILLEHYAPASVVVDQAFNIVRFHGSTELFWQPAPGPASSDLLTNTRQELRGEVAAALEEAQDTDAPARREHLRRHEDGNEQEIQLTVIPFKSQTTLGQYFIIVFETGGDQSSAVSKAIASPGATSEAEDLSQELATTKSYMKVVVEEQETALEELQVAHEEIISSNEELQITNEELVTAKEELQAANEELSSLNAELENRFYVATRLNNDLANLVDSLNIPTIVLGEDLTIRRYSPSAQRLLDLSEEDEGRPIGNFKRAFGTPDVEDLAWRVMDSLETCEREIIDAHGHWHKLYLRPYKTLEVKIEGVVLSLIDINTLKLREQQLLGSRARTQAIIDTAADAIITLDEQDRIESYNQATESLLGYNSTELLGEKLERLVPIVATGTGRRVSEFLQSQPTSDEQSKQEVRALRKDRSTTPVEMSLSHARWDQGRLTTVMIHDLNARKELEDAITQATADEQMRIGHELHDSAGQELTGLSYMALILENMLANRAGAEKELARKIREGLSRTLAQVRALAHGLMPVEVDAEGLMAALQQMARRKSETFGVQVSFRCDNPVQLPDNQQANQLFLIAREAVLNAVKHGKARQVEIGLSQDADELNLTVRDNGTGIPPGLDPAKGLGLRIMRHRASLIGGHLSIQAASGGGTAVICSLSSNSD